MACEVRWTASARSDVEGMVRHIAVVLGSPKAAAEHLDAFLAAADRISNFPEMHATGSQPALACRNLRPYLVKNYVVLYSYDGDAAAVHRVFHARRDYARLIEFGTANGSTTER